MRAGLRFISFLKLKRTLLLTSLKLVTPPGTQEGLEKLTLLKPQKRDKIEFLEKGIDKKTEALLDDT